MKLRIRLLHTHPPGLDDQISWLTAQENVQGVHCSAGRLRYRDGRPKSYKSKHAILLVLDKDKRMTLDNDECPDFEPDE